MPATSSFRCMRKDYTIYSNVQVIYTHILNYALLAEDSVDFDVSLANINVPDKIATVTVRHVPPARPDVRLPVAWMRTPVGNTPNNWVEITKNFASKSAADKYVASVGMETFDVEMKISLTN